MSKDGLRDCKESEDSSGDIPDSGSIARVDLVSAEGGSERFLNTLKLVSAVIEGVVVLK